MKIFGAELTREVFSYGWMYWIGFFVVLEGLAFASKVPASTLSAHVWGWLGNNSTRAWAVGVFLVWLLVHMVTKGKV